MQVHAQLLQLWHWVSSNCATLGLTYLHDGSFLLCTFRLTFFAGCSTLWLYEAFRHWNYLDVGHTNIWLSLLRQGPLTRRLANSIWQVMPPFLGLLLTLLLCWSKPQRQIRNPYLSKWIMRPGKQNMILIIWGNPVLMLGLGLLPIVSLFYLGWSIVLEHSWVWMGQLI